MANTFNTCRSMERISVVHSFRDLPWSSAHTAVIKSWLDMAYVVTCWLVKL